MLDVRSYQLNTDNQAYQTGVLALACPFCGPEFEENSTRGSYHGSLSA